MQHHPIINQVLKWVAACLLLLLYFPGLAQESILTANDNATGTGGTVTYSVGQIAVRTIETANGTVTQGVQQPYEILFMTGLEDEKAISLDFVVYPNPASSAVRLKINRPSVERLRYELRNNNGLLLSDVKIETNETAIPITELPAGVYLLSVLEDNNSLATWKVLKK